MATNSLKLQSVLYEISDEELDLLSEKDLLAFSRNELTEEELNELLGFTRKKTLIKQIMERDPEADEEELKVLSKAALKKMLKDLKEEGGEDTRGFFAKAKDLGAGGMDAVAGMFGNRAGTLLGGTETFDKKKRDGMKAKGKATAEKWMAKIEYQPLTDIYSKMQSAKFPNAAGKGEFKTQSQEFQKVYDDIVKAHDAEQIETATANVIISVLRGVVIYFQDFAMNDQYYYREHRELSLDMMLLEAPEGQEEEEEEKIGAAEGDVSANFEAAYGMKLPLVLISTGAGLMAAGFLADSDLVLSIMQGMKDVTEVTKAGKVIKSSVEKIVPLGGVKPGEGIIRVVRRLIPGAEKFGLAGGPSMGDVFGGGKNATVLKLIKASMMNSGGSSGIDGLISSNADPLTTFVHGAMSGTGKMVPVDTTLYGIHSGKFSDSVTTEITNQMPDTTQIIEDDTLRNKVLEGLMKWGGAGLKGLGLGFIGGGLASAFMRWKGKGGKKGSGLVRGSRMSILKILVDGFKDLTGKGEPVPPTPPGGEEVEIVVDLDHTNFVMTVTMKDEEGGEEPPPEEPEGPEIGFEERRFLPHLPMLVEYGLTAPDYVRQLLSEVSDGFNATQKFKVAGGPYPKDEGNFGKQGQKSLDDYKTLTRILAQWTKAHPTAQENELTMDDIEDAIKGAKFTLNDLRKEEEEPPGDEKISYDVDLEDDETKFAAKTKDGEEDAFIKTPGYTYDEVPKDPSTASSEPTLADIFRAELDNLPTPPDADAFMISAEDEENPDTEYSVDDKRTEEEEPVSKRPRLGLIRLDDDGLKVSRTSDRYGDKKYDAAKTAFQAAQDQGITGRDTSPSTDDIGDDYGIKARGRSEPHQLTYKQMVGKGRAGLAKNLKPGVEVEPYFTLDKSAHSDLYLKTGKPLTVKGMGKLDKPKLGASQKARSEKVLKLVMKKFVAGKKKLTQSQANKIVSNYWGDKRKKHAVDKTQRDKIVQILVAYGLVSESVDQSDNLLTESAAHSDQTFDRWATLAGIGTNK